MKYLKITLGLFAISTILLLCDAQASDIHTLKDIKIKILSGHTIIKEAKLGFNEQFVKKTGCIDDISKDGRAIEAGLHLTTDSANPNGDPAWKEVPQGKKVGYGTNSQKPGSWNLYLRSKKSFLTTATFNGEWYID